MRSIRLAREIEVGRKGRKLSDDLGAVWAGCRDVLSTPGTLRTVLLVGFGLLHVIGGLGSFLFVGTVIFAVAQYLGLGPAGLLATLTGRGFYMVRPILSVTFLGMGGVLMLSSSVDKWDRSKDVS